MNDGLLSNQCCFHKGTPAGSSRKKSKEMCFRGRVDRANNDCVPLFSRVEEFEVDSFLLFCVVAVDALH